MKRYYILVDKLDENWVDDEVKYHLIRALIETAKDFNKVEHAKIILALRRDLIERVFARTRDAGFQQEKYESLYLEVDWPTDKLTEVLDKRVGRLVRQRYTKQPVTAKDVLTKHVNKQSPIDYMLERAMRRPRDVIQYFNECIALAMDRPVITADMIHQAEASYSKKRLVSICDEWYADYPNLAAFVEILKGRKSRFVLSDIDEQQCTELCTKMVSSVLKDDELGAAAQTFANGKNTSTEFLARLMSVLHHVGIVGLKLETWERVSWSFDGHRRVDAMDIRPSTRVTIHKCVWRALGIQPSE